MSNSKNKIISITAAILIYVFILLFVYIIHVRFFKVDVLFYSSIFDGLISLVIVSLIIYNHRIYECLNDVEKILIILILLLGGYSFSISIPTVLDRSLSFYILEKLQQRGGGIKESKIADVFTQEYMIEHHLVGVRLTEQLQSGTIIIENGCVKITEKGSIIARIARYLRMNYLPKYRLIMGEYSDKLTDPFKNSQQNINYTCE